VPTAPSILVVEDEPEVRAFVVNCLSDAGHAVVEAGSLAEARAANRRAPVALTLLDLHLPDGDGIELLRQLRETDPTAKVVMLTGHGSVATAVEALRLGALDYLQKPVDPEVIELTVRRALGPTKSAPSAGRITGKTRAIKAVRRAVAQVAQTPRTTALILGESGTGKEVVARAIHVTSPRAAHPFVAINCAALSETLLESELFGYEPGAFSGALKGGRDGLLAAAEGGTLLLDEIGEMSLTIQAKLLRVLQEREYLPVGGSQVRSVNVRIVAATNRDLVDAAAQGKFREDLYYRLNVVQIRVPPLRERVEDIRPLARRFLGEVADELGKTFRGFSKAAMTRLMAYPWPGNVRELRNVVERAAIRAQGPQLKARHVELDAPRTPPPFPRPAPSSSAAAPPTAPTKRLPAPDLPAPDEAPRRLADVERDHILRTLEHCGGNKRRAAEVLGIHRTTLAKKLEEYGVGSSPDDGDSKGP